MLSLYPDANPTAVVDSLSDGRRRLANVASIGGQAVDRLNGWRKWAGQSATDFQFLLTNSVVRERVLGPKHDLLQSLDPIAYGNGLAALVDSEIAHRLLELDRTIGKLRKDIKVWASGRDVALVLDTNILMTFGERILSVDWESKARRIGGVVRSSL